MPVIPIHADRNTVVTLNDHLPSPVQPWTAIERDASQMGRSSLAEIDGVHYLSGIGWQLRAYQYDPGKTHELTLAQAGVYPLSAWAYPSTAVEYDSFRQSGLTGVSYGSGVQSAGSPFIGKRVPASGTWNTGLTADQAAFPSPTTALDTVSMDRYLALTANYEPSDALFFRFYIPGSAVLNSGTLISFFFNGPAGSDDKGVGNGQYAIKLAGDALARVYERLADLSGWVLRHTFKWEQTKQGVHNALHFLAIYNNCREASGWPGDTILFNVGSIVDDGQLLIESQIGLAISAIKSAHPDQYGLVFRVPRVTEEPIAQAPIRVDMRRDMRVWLQTAKATYPDEGTLYDDVISLPYYPDDSEDLRLEWYGDVPTGTTLDGQIYDADTGVELTNRVLIGTDEIGGIVEYTPNVRQRRYRVKLTFESDATNTKTPTLRRFMIYRAAVFDTPSVTEVEIPDRDAAPALAKTDIERVEVQGPTMDNTIDSASITVRDYVGTLPFANQSGNPIKVELEYNSSGDKTTIFRGYVERASGAPYTGDGLADDWQGFDSRVWNVQCTGEFQRLQETLCPERYTWINQETGEPFKITQAIEILTNIAYPISYISIPDIDVKLFPSNEDALVTEPGSRVGETCTKFLRDYLGAYLLWDDSIGTEGKWRVLEQKRGPDYNYLVRFEVEHPGGATLGHVEAAYGTSTNGSQTVTHTYIKHGTLNEYWEKPEGNHIMVIGGATGADGGKAGAGAARLSQVAINVNSYDAMNVGAGNTGYPDTDPENNPDYIGRMVPIYYVDSSLATQKAVDWVCRRIYDYAAHARHIMTFEAPLTLVTDVEDTEQQRPRPLRFYDFVQVYWRGSWQTYIVLECSPVYTKDKFQWARYTLVRPSNLDDVAVLRRGGTPWERFLKAAQNATGSMAVNGVNFSKNIGLRTSTSDLVVLPEPSASPLQELDPADPDYGAFNYMADYDPIL